MTGNSAILLFHDEVKDLLAPGNRDHGRVEYPVARRASVKDVIEALGPPHTEVGSIRVDGREAGFEHLLLPGETVHVHPFRPPVDTTQPDPPLRPEPLPRTAFAVDACVGRLASLLRLLGFDAAHHRHWSDADVAQVAVVEKRIVLTRDRALLKRSNITWARLVRSHDPRLQLREVLDFFGLTPPYAAFTRCLRCNTPLRPVAKQDVLHRLEPLTKKYFNEFHTCPDCGRVYWPGSHHDRMEEEFL